MSSSICKLLQSKQVNMRLLDEIKNGKYIEIENENKQLKAADKFVQKLKTTNLPIYYYCFQSVYVQQCEFNREIFVSFY